MGLVHEGVTLSNAIAKSSQVLGLCQVREYPVNNSFVRTVG